MKKLTDKVSKIIKEREKSYGDATTSFKKIATLWSGYLDKKIKASDVAHMMSILKIVRATHSYKEDNYIDIMGYIELANKIIVKENNEK